MIVKIQRPLTTNGDEPLALIYNRDRDFQVTVPFIWVDRFFTPDDLKIYAKAEFIKSEGSLEIIEILPEQDF